MFGSTRAGLRTLAAAALVGIVVSACGGAAAPASPAASTAASNPATEAPAATTAPETAAPSAAVKPLTVILSSSAVDAQIANVVKGMEGAIPDLNAANGLDVKLEVTDAGMNADKQISDLQTAIVKQPGVILVDPVDLNPIVSVIEQAKAAGIKVCDTPAVLGSTLKSVI